MSSVTQSEAAETSPYPFEFLGTKRRLLRFITEAIAARAQGATDVADLFAGTGAVSAALKRRGYRVIANDLLGWCSTVTASILLNDLEPTFDGIVDALPWPELAPYDRVLRRLNELPPSMGFIRATYSPDSEALAGVRRMYFTPDNAGRIDAIRRQIREWSDVLRAEEKHLLLADLARASDAVSNVAGTYGCYLKDWKARALAPLRLSPATFVRGEHGGHQVHCMDAETLALGLDVPVVYADPPYTKRQYAAYYHLLETIVLDDSPDVSGSTGLRPWREKASDFCYRRRAPEALRRLVDALSCQDFFLSYSEDGQITHSEILAILGRRGQVEVLEHTLPRYRSSDLPHKGPWVRERLYHLRLASASALAA